MKGWTGMLFAVAVAALVAGCAVYTPRDISAVEDLIRQAEAAGAKQKAPYEYYSAVEHLNVSKEELSEADDENAKVFGEKAKAMAEKALQKSR